MFAVMTLTKVVDSAMECHWRNLKRIIRYLKGTKDVKLAYEFGKELELESYADADFGNDSNRKSISGFAAKLCGGLVSWCSRNQKLVALSTMEAEYISLSNATQETLFLKQLIEELVEITIGMKIYVDNQSCISYAENDKGPGRSKHISIKYHFVKDLVEKNELKLIYVSSSENVADVFTKPLAKEKHRRAMKLLNMLNT